jgi:hypothetical protein
MRYCGDRGAAVLAAMTAKLISVRIGLAATAAALLFVFGWWWYGEP